MNKPTYNEIFTLKNLIESDFAVRKHRKNKSTIKCWDQDRLNNQKKLLDDIVMGRYEVSPYYNVNVMLEKPRTLAILPHKDRIVQDMLLKSMKPYFDNIFIYHSYACIVGRGTTQCIRNLKEVLVKDKKNTKYYIQLDIYHYFPSVNGDLLKQMVKTIIKDERLLELHYKVIDSYDGLPIGNSTSQYYANLFISYLLHKLLSKFNKYKIYVFVYMDDIIILCENKEYLIDIRNFISEELNKIKLQLKNPNVHVYVVRKNGIRFLGYQLFGDYTLFRRNVTNRIWDKINKFCDGKISRESFVRSFASYSGMFKLANTRNLSLQMYNYILERTGEKFYFNNWDGEIIKISKIKGCKIRIHDLTTFNKKLRIDFVYHGKSYRILSQSKKLYEDLKNKWFKHKQKPFNYKFT